MGAALVGAWLGGLEGTVDVGGGLYVRFFESLLVSFHLQFGDVLGRFRLGTQGKTVRP